jgi:hypothetical protein
MKSGMVKKLLLLVLVVSLFLMGMVTGRSMRPKTVEIRTYHDIFGAYPIDQEVKCANQRSLGRIQADLDLTNGKWKIVRNDPGKHPDCR